VWQALWLIFGPRQELVERGAKGLTPTGEAVVNSWRHFWMDGARHDAISFELPQLLSQHLL
jgi:hypothetical protein